MSFSLRTVLPVTIVVSSAFAIIMFYFYAVFGKKQKAIVIAAERLKKNFNNYEVNNYIHKIEMLKNINNCRNAANSLIEIYNLVVSSNDIDVNLKIRLRIVLKSKGINIK